MKLRLLSAILLTTLLAGCPEDQKKPAKAKGDKFSTQKPPVATKDQSGDVTFQSFVGRLRIAVEKHDLATLTLRLPLGSRARGRGCVQLLGSKQSLERAGGPRA
jgi:type IV pilus biogenesis protein CpaD/CtpE